jgi:hypothetical protein
MAIEPPPTKAHSVVIRSGSPNVVNAQGLITNYSTRFANPHNWTCRHQIRVLKRWDSLFKKIEHYSGIFSPLNLSRREIVRIYTVARKSCRIKVILARA